MKNIDITEIDITELEVLFLAFTFRDATYLQLVLLVIYFQGYKNGLQELPSR